MKKPMLFGVGGGGLCGIMAAWVAMSDAVPAGGLVTLAGVVDGVLAGLGIGWLVGINVAEGTLGEADGLTTSPSHALQQRS